MKQCFLDRTRECGRYCAAYISDPEDMDNLCTILRAAKYLGLMASSFQTVATTFSDVAKLDEVTGKRNDGSNPSTC